LWTNPSYAGLADASWFARYRKGGYVNWHIHKEYVDLVVVWYLQSEEGMGDFVYKCDNEQHHISVKTGDMLIFPGTLLHSTFPNTIDKDRIIMSTDLCLTRQSARALEKLGKFDKAQVDKLYQERQLQIFNKIKECNEINAT
jgi:ectoine hydroxylase-related dioxygenase (phytanoyl-CoA dioxygenase family)